MGPNNTEKEAWEAPRLASLITVLLGFSTIKHIELSSPNLLVSDKFSECSFAVILIPDSAESYSHKAQKTNQ